MNIKKIQTPFFYYCVDLNFEVADIYTQNTRKDNKKKKKTSVVNQ